MNDILREPTIILLPLVAGLAVFALLLAIRRPLRQAGMLRGFGIVYTVGALVLSLAASATVLRWVGYQLDPTARLALLAVNVCCWGIVSLGLVEELLVRRFAGPGGPPIPRLALDIGRAVAFIVVILLTLSLVLGVQLSSVVISSTILSAVIGLALQDLLKNVFAGIALQAEQPFQVGHWVEINKQIGRVVEMSWRATRVITIDNNYIIYPNSSLAQAELINYTLGSPLQALHVQIGVGYAHPPNLVKRVLAEAALAAPDICHMPPPSIKVVQYGDYSVTYDVKFWIGDFDRYSDKRDAVMTSAWYHLRRAGIKLPFPIRDVYMHQVDALTEADQHHARVESLVATLRQVDLFRVLDKDELRTLAEHASLRLYGAGEVLARQGEAGDTFFVIRDGQVRIDVAAANNGDAVKVNTLGPGEFFGELALLTGAPRGATVVAERDTETLVVAQNDLAPLLHANATLPERLGAVLEQRMAMNQVALAAHDTAEHRPTDDISRPTLVRRMRHLFGLDSRQPPARAQDGRR